MSMSSRRYWDGAQNELGSLPFLPVPTAHTLAGTVETLSALTGTLKLGLLFAGAAAAITAAAGDLTKTCQLYGSIGALAAVAGRTNVGRLGRASVTHTPAAEATVTDS